MVFWNFNHFLVLERTDNDRYWINDPANGRRCLDLQEFDRGYTGVVITMQPDASFRQTSKPRHPIYELWHWLSRGSKTKRWGLLFTLGVSAGLLSQTARLLTTPELAINRPRLGCHPNGQVVSRELNGNSAKNFKNSSSAFRSGSFNSTSAMNWQDVWSGSQNSRHSCDSSWQEFSTDSGG